MQVYDILMLLVLVGAVLFGAWKGFAWQVASMAAIFVSYFVALTFRAPVAAMIKTEEPWNRFIAMFGLFLVTSLAIWILFGFISRTIEKMRLKDWDRQAGAALGAVKGVMLCLVITFFAVTLLNPSQKDAICGSYSGRYIASAIQKLPAIMPQELQAVLQPHLDKLGNELQKNHANEGSNSNPELPNLTELIPDAIFGKKTDSQTVSTGNQAKMPSLGSGPQSGGAKQGILDSIPIDPSKIDWRKIDWERAAKAISERANENR
jgi:membrane protein required for colicin V production